VFTAFSGSHQDAIHKGLNQRQELLDRFGAWKLPYLHIAPQDIGRNYEKFIRINSQSGKGGIAHVLQHDYGVRLPRPLLVELSRHVQAFADTVAREVSGEEVWNILRQRFVIEDGPIRLLNYWPRPDADVPERIDGEVHLEFNGEKHVLLGSAVGPIAAFAKAIRQLPLPEFTLHDYEEDAIGTTADAEAITFIGLQTEAGKLYHGIGFGSNIDQAAVRAFVSGLNAILRETS
jgi:2-isopropylmalate synthase